jgi:hypothetical protein
MPGPSQREVLRLKVVLGTDVEVRQALRRKGFRPARISQLMTECSQNPPRSAAQMELQTAQDQPNCNQSQHVYDFPFFSKNRHMFLLFFIFLHFFRQKRAKKRKKEKNKKKKIDLMKHLLN